MYDVDGNGSVDLTEMTRILSSLYKMMGPGGRQDRAEERALSIFHRMDVSISHSIPLLSNYSLSFRLTMTAESPGLSLYGPV